MKGFTLLEIIIAVTILAFLSIMTAQSIQQGVQSKAKIEKELNETSQVRDVLEIIAADVEKAFNYRDINIQMYNEAQEERLKAKQQAKNINNNTPGQTNPNDPDAPPTPPPASSVNNPNEPQFKKREEKILTHFVGNSDSIHFTTLNNFRRFKDSQVSSQAEVGYFLKDCRNRVNKDKRSKCLWRRSSPEIDDDVTKGGTEIALLENVQEFEIQYIVPKYEEEWIDKSDSTAQGREETRNKFPYAVEITLEVQDKSLKSSKPVRMSKVAQIRFPNNPKDKPKEEEKDGQNPDGSQTPQPSGS